MKKIKMKKIESSVVQALDYDRSAKTMIVELRGGTSPYVYSGISKYRYYELKNAKSVGEYFNKKIKGKYQSYKAPFGQAA